ncbi:GPW/gp25 family protein [Streptomyces sp. NPDC057302]|uniref:GPW/gp25 family protein n=1 Tax=Streptomyces sp. NPDC057302 TaxID=3346094 RepID=UPI0036367A08
MAGDEAGLGCEFLGVGWAFPVTVEPDTGLIARATYEQDIEQSILIILSTAKGERVMRPDFGCGIHDLVFAAITTQRIAEIAATVREALRDHEARIDVRDVRVDTGRLDLGYLEVHIHYEVRATNQPGNVVYPFYFQESANR